MNVTKEEYLAALAIVEKYHSQSGERDRLHEESFNGLKKGDFVRYIGGINSKYMTVGKLYRLTGEPDKKRLWFVMDNGVRKVGYKSCFEKV